ncbi:hypothetical protein [Janthinobacterium sp. HLX7-2]|uniref:hypothetical protein n=1 Tax=Janthinobacterium sp. HLX7-2 TaxID=1259331 RepID=UPI003F2348AF
MNKFQESRMEKIRSSVTDIFFPLEKWRYFVLFQSKSQALSWIVTLLACMVIISYLVSLDGDANIPLDGILFGAAIGSSFSLVAVLPAKFIVADNGLGMLSEIEVRLLKMNYVDEKRINGIYIYRQNLPRLLRWDEGNIKISDDGDTLSVSGGYFSLRKLRSSLLKDFF